MFLRILLSTIGAFLIGLLLDSFAVGIHSRSYSSSYRISFDLADPSGRFIILFLFVGLFVGVVWGLWHKGIFDKK